MTLRIATWSGPRNISTALMRSWENREDCAVVDEPLYAHYLAETGLAHPVAEAVIASQSTDWRQVTQTLCGAPECGSPLWYQKHMTHHLLPCMGREWLESLTHVFLIRDPTEVVASYLRSRSEATLEDLGLPQQWELFEYVTGPLGRPALVLDSRDVLEDPEGMLRALCARLGIPFSERMLKWPAGPRDSDGVWADHWYTSVHQSTGFAPYRARNPELSAEARNLAEAGRGFYEGLRAQRLLPA